MQITDMDRDRMFRVHDVGIHQPEASTFEGNREFCPGIGIPMVKGKYHSPCLPLQHTPTFREDSRQHCPETMTAIGIFPSLQSNIG